MSLHSGEYVIAKKQFGYAGKTRDPGEVFMLVGMKNDDKIWGLKIDGKPKLARYTEPFRGNIDGLVVCPECGARFALRGLFEQHYERRHNGGK